MSEYQYYEWQAVDRPLSLREQEEVDGLSSHMDTVSSTQAIVTYSWGDFKHDPQKVLLKYFDAFLYDSNFGVRELMFRFPKGLLDAALAQPYLIDDWILLEAKGSYDVLHLIFDSDAGFFEWIESEGILGRLIPLREQLLQGDMRMLYLAWLKAVSMHDPDEWEDEPEPPVPAGLKQLNASLRAFADFLEIDLHLIAAAAQASESDKMKPEPDLKSAIAKMTREETDAYLLTIARGEPGALLSLKKHLAVLSGAGSPSQAQSTRTVGELFELAKRRKAEASRKARQEAERRRIQGLERLAAEEDGAWSRVDNLLSQKRGTPYDEAVRLLVELREMADYKNRRKTFSERFGSILEKYGRSAALTNRFRRAKLI